jgi:DNA repair protein RecN (Recombination protein N)
VNSADTIQFLVQTNRGEPSRPLGKIASGGELSRLMLAIRRVIADRGGIGVYLFDEIDAGIGGQTAFEVGRKLKSVASYNQVICITHLPQVASFADHHLTVHKSVVDNRTITAVLELTLKERKIELARMLGGRELTKRSIDNASELIDLAAM